MRTARHFRLVPLLSILAVALPALALEYPLSDTAIRNAFMTGNNKNDRAAEAFLKYVRSFPAPARGPHIAAISIQTPYEQIAELGATTRMDYHAQEAEQEFGGKPMPLLVRVQINFTSTYPIYPQHSPNAGQSILQPLSDYEHDFKIDAIQGRIIPRKAKRAYLIYSTLSRNAFGTAGIIIEQEYDPAKFDSSPLTIEVRAPEDLDLKTTFDLSQLQ